jgi:hypothetical protein
MTTEGSGGLKYAAFTERAERTKVTIDARAKIMSSDSFTKKERVGGVMMLVRA